MIQNSGDKVTWLGVGFYALRISIFIRGLLQLVHHGYQIRHKRKPVTKSYKTNSFSKRYINFIQSTGWG
jgi:hypothetical protein